MTIVGQIDRLRHRGAGRTPEPRVVVTGCGQTMAFVGRKVDRPVRECPACYSRTA